ncbi:hypothetical protein CL634_02215 [bacterium]|nr:hypothetical protein [bacterium]|tara:strand:- start:238 stop:513 length:276 start_codon:yes stop_codon:yes gene_type:complete
MTETYFTFRCREKTENIPPGFVFRTGTMPKDFISKDLRNIETLYLTHRFDSRITDLSEIEIENVNEVPQYPLPAIRYKSLVEGVKEKCCGE